MWERYDCRLRYSRTAPLCILMILVSGSQRPQPAHVDKLLMLSRHSFQCLLFYQNSFQHTVLFEQVTQNKSPIHHRVVKHVSQSMHLLSPSNSLGRNPFVPVHPLKSLLHLVIPVAERDKGPFERSHHVERNTLSHPQPLQTPTMKCKVNPQG